ncbi:hypothetical protein [Permianibacter aggregans]|nr:hypothetical protein [Permianibacter aggregans]
MKTEELFNDGDVDEEKKKIYYRVMIRGAMDAGNPLRGNFTDWQAKAKMNPELYQRKADHLRPGENLRIILINRQTGYIGSLTTPLKNINQGGYGAISFPIAEIKMLPPNLSVRVERRTTVEHGLTKNEERHYQVGYEGGATANDNVIEIFTEWYEQDGRPLPEELGEYGYTGRLAKIVAENELAPEGGDLANFTIKPGKNRQVIRVKDEAITREHYYVHVHAESKNNNPDFATLGAGEGKLQYRPAHYVPFKVAVFDEKATIISRNAWRQARQEGQVTGRFPLPAYRWLYRPEMQFSLFELQMKKILHGADGEQGEDMLHAETPGLSNVDDFVNLSYNLLINDIAPLPLLGEERELLFAIGEQELAATVGSDQQLRFRNLNHFTALRPEDFLTMRLYFNHDPENLLWEFAFEYLALSTTIVGSPAHGGGLFRVSADEPTVPMVSWLVGYGQRDKKYKSPRTLRWVAEGTQAAFENEEVDQENGVFTATVAMPRTAGARTTVNAILEGNPDIIAKWGEILVVPGEPHDLQTTVDGEMHIERHGTVTVDVTSVDKYNNKVADGTQIAYEVIGPVNIETKQDEFIDGKARIVLSGDSLVDPEAKLTIRVGELTREIPLQVKPLKVTWEALPPTFETRKTYNLSVKVTTEAGEPAAGVDVIFDSNFGKFEQGLPKTDAQGIATIRFFTGLHEKTGRVSARVGLVEAKHKEVTPSSPIPQKANTSETILVGDATIDGAVEYVRYDGLRIGVPYRAKANVLINDNVGSQHDLKIGSLAEPNRAPLASYFLNQLDYTVVPDETGLHHGRGEKVTLVGDHPLGMGQSLFFGADAKVEVTAKPSLQPADGLGFRLDIKPYQPGDVIKLAAGTQKVEYTADNRIQFTVTTTAGPVSIASHVLSLNEWHTVGARVLNGQLELEVNGQAATPVAVPNPLAYGFGQGIEMGGFEGLLSSVSLYDWRSSPLVKFSENGQEQLSFTVADGEGGNAISVESTGALNSAQQDSAIRTLRVGLTLASEQHYISLVDRDFYGELMGSAVAHGSSAPPVQFDENGQLIVRNQFKAVPLWDSVIPVAHAGIFDWIAENAWEIFTEAIGFVIPFNEAKSLFEQVGYMMDNEWDKVNYVTLTFDAMSILSFVAPPIRAAMVPLRRIIAPLANKPFVKAIGGVIGTYAGKLRKGKFDDLLKLVPYFMILGEMAFDEEGREALLVMFNAIESADDFIVWVDYLSLPALGWDGEGEPPPVDTEGEPVDDVVVAANFEFEMRQPNLMDGIFPKAYAAKPSKARIAGKGATKLVSGAAATKAARERPKEITHSMKSIRELMLEGGSKGLRKMIFNPSLMIANLRKKASDSAYGVTALLTGKSNARLHPALIIGIFVYLEDRMHDCEISKKLKLQGCIPIPEHSPLLLEHHEIRTGKPEGEKYSALHNEIDELFSRVIIDAASKPSELEQEEDEEGTSYATYVQGYAQGAMWHLAMIAFHHASYEVTGKQPIVAIERGVLMEVYGKEVGGKLEATTTLASGRPIRGVDIELGNGGDGSDNTWVEVKSLRDITANTKGKHECQWSPWVMLRGDTYTKPNIANTGCKTKSTYGKQFFLDARATAKFSQTQEGKTYADDMKWLLQNFKVNSKTFKRKEKPYTIKPEKSFSKATYDRTVTLLRRMAEPAGTKLNLGGNIEVTNGLVSKSYVESRLRRATFIELISGQIKDKFLKNLPQEVIDEMMQEEFTDE